MAVDVERARASDLFWTVVDQRLAFVALEYGQGSVRVKAMEGPNGLSEATVRRLVAIAEANGAALSIDDRGAAILRARSSG